MSWNDPNWAGPVFCCDGYGNSGLHDPWCDGAAPEEQEHWHISQHIGVVDFSIVGPPYRCDSEECCGDDDSDDGCGVAHP